MIRIQSNDSDYLIGVQQGRGMAREPPEVKQGRGSTSSSTFTATFTISVIKSPGTTFTATFTIPVIKSLGKKIRSPLEGHQEERDATDMVKQWRGKAGNFYCNFYHVGD